MTRDAPTPSRRASALIVDQEPSRRDVCGRLLRRHGYSVRVAASSRDILACAVTVDDLELVVIDLDLPGCFEIVAAICESSSSNSRDRAARHGPPGAPWNEVARRLFRLFWVALGSPRTRGDCEARLRFPERIVFVDPAMPQALELAIDPIAA